MDSKTLILLLINLAVIIYLVRKVWLRSSDGISERRSEAELQIESGSGNADATRSLYEISDALGWAYQQSALPADLQENDDFKRGISLLASDHFNSKELADYFGGNDAIIACLAVSALRERDDGPEVRERVLDYMGSVAPWPLYFALQYLASVTPAGEPVIGQAIARMKDYLHDRQCRLFLEEFIDERLGRGETPHFGDDMEALSDEQLQSVWDFLTYLDSKLGEPLQSELRQWSERRIDWELLRSIGTVWDAQNIAETEKIIEHDSLDKAVRDAEKSLCSARPRSLLFVGEEGVGKSTIIALLARRLNERGWTIFQAGHSELIAGQTYIGQLEDRVQTLLRQLRGSRRILWIVPDFYNLSYSGLHQYSPVSVLDTMLPYIQTGDITIVSIAEPAAYERLVQWRQAVSSALSVRRIKPMPAGPAKELARACLQRWSGRTHEKIVDEAWELAQQFLTDKSAPGNILKLLALTWQRLVSEKKFKVPELHIDDMMVTLSDLTGLPTGILDDRRQLDVDGLQDLFNARVLGQNEAVECLVERVAMIKAGVTDPNRPAGVFLFCGPTGTGKTELAKSLAEWLFGSPKRMIRFDMSEFQIPEDLSRLMGDADAPNTKALVDLIREQPFSVILLDEFEKAHPRIWDLFLQVFDDGRLTDRKGQIADFRHAIIILTSNLGSVIPAGVSLGFRPDNQGFDRAAVIRSVEKAFRKEFINRLDRVVVFRPLTRDMMRKILEKELLDVLKRRGLRSRPWAVEWDESAIDFLLEKGFTPDLGARPLKRAIERFLLSPLALTMVKHQVPEGDQFLFVTRGSSGLHVQFVDPDEPDRRAVLGEDDDSAHTLDGERQLTLTGIALEPHGTPEEIIFLQSQYDQLVSIVEGDDWQTQKSMDLSSMQTSEFWESEGRFSVLDMIERRDRIESGTRRAGSLMQRLNGKASATRRQYPENLVGLLSQNLYLLNLATESIQEGCADDAFLRISIGHASADEAASTVAFAKDLADMYRAWAKLRRMRFGVLEESYGENAESYLFVASISGFGAYSILSQEQGLHVFEQPAKKQKGYQRLRTIVEVVPQRHDLQYDDRSELKSQAEDTLGRKSSKPKIVRRYREKPSPLVRDNIKGWRTGRIDQVLEGNFDLIEKVPA